MSPTSAERRPDWVLWSRILIAIVVGGGALLIEMTEGAGLSPHYRPGSPWLLVDVALGLAALPALVYRREHPLPVMLLTALLGSVSMAAGGAAAVAAVSVCARRRWTEMAVVALATVAGSIVLTRLHIPAEEREPTYIWSVVLTAVFLAIGWLIGQGREDRREAWGNAWRMALALLSGMVVWVALAAEGTAMGFTEDHLWLAVDPLIGVIAVCLLPLRRRWPFPVLVATCVLAVVAATASGAALVVLASISTSRNWRRIVIAAVINDASGLLFGVLHDTDPGLTDLITNTALVGCTVAFGLFIGARRELVANLRAQVVAARREQEARVVAARTHERARIAREMHDVLAHRISLVAMHAGALAYRDDLPPAQVRTTATLLHDTSHQALRELREVLGVLREQDGTSDGRPEPPQPTLADLDELVDTARSGGQDVLLTQSIAVNELPDLISRNAFRIVQESLTNARKHAEDQTVTVRLAGRPGEKLFVEVRNPRTIGAAPAAPGAGLGLVGLRERATLTGGTLTAGTDRAGDFVVRATIPWTQHEEE